MSVLPALSDTSSSDVLGFGPGPGPSMDWKESPEAHIFKLDVPGLRKEDVKLQLYDDRVLHISAETKEEQDYGDKWHCRERLNAGSFCREFRLPENVMVDEIKASMSDGVLVVTVPKDATKKKKKPVKKYSVVIDVAEDSGSPKGLSRFVCCKP